MLFFPHSIFDVYTSSSSSRRVNEARGIHFTQERIQNCEYSCNTDWGINVACLSTEVQYEESRELQTNDILKVSPKKKRSCHVRKYPSEHNTMTVNVESFGYRLLIKNILIVIIGHYLQ